MTSVDPNRPVRIVKSKPDPPTKETTIIGGKRVIKEPEIHKTDKRS